MYSVVGLQKDPERRWRSSTEWYPVWRCECLNTALESLHNGLKTEVFRPCANDWIAYLVG